MEPDPGSVRLYLAVVFWGEEFRRYFLDYCLASLMAPGNIPSISDKLNARLLIATTENDWRAMQSEPIFRTAQAAIPVEHILHEVSDNIPSAKKLAVTSQAHKKLAQRMFADRAHGVFIYPDMIAATNFLSKLEELAFKGAKAVLYMNVRFANEKALEELAANGALRPGQPLAIAAPELVRLTIRHMHSEMARGNFDNNCFDYGCASFFWVVPPGDNLVFHCGSWVPMLVDYGSIINHDVSTFDSWTLDGDYVAKNFPDFDQVYASRDSDELFMISFTPESKVHYSLAPYLPYRFSWSRFLIKTFLAHRYLYGQGILDDIKKELIRLPVRLSGGYSSETQWREVEGRAARVVRRIEQKQLPFIERIPIYALDVALRLFRLRLLFSQRHWSSKRPERRFGRLSL